MAWTLTGSLASIRKYSVTPTGNGTGTKDVVHSLNTEDVEVIVKRIAVTGGAPIGKVEVFWKVVDANTIQVDFDTYSRATNEFRVTVMG